MEQNTKAAANALPDITEAEGLMHEVHRLLVHSESALDQEGVKQQAETLERWLESYRRGLAAAQKLCQNSDTFLHDMRERLVLGRDEILRLEGEGGLPLTKDQKKQMEDLTHAIKRIDHLVESLGSASFKAIDTMPPSVTDTLQ